MSSRLCVAAILAILALAALTGPVRAQAPSSSFPASFEKYLAAEVRPTATERMMLLSGAPFTKVLPSDANREVFVFGAVWINAPQSEYVARVNDIENLEKGGSFRITKKISNPPRLEDFAQLELPAEDVRDLRRCEAGNCELKISEKGLEALKAKIRLNTPNEKADADAAMRQLALDYVVGYREGGNARLAVYRDAARPVFVANEFRAMIERAPSLVPIPDLLKYLLEYPASSLPGASDFLYWQDTTFGLKPTIRINHLVIQQRDGQTVVASKLLYASHYFLSGLEQRVLLTDPGRGPGFWFVTINRGRADGLSGFGAQLVRSRVRSEVQNGIQRLLTSTKATLEQ